VADHDFILAEGIATVAIDEVAVIALLCSFHDSIAADRFNLASGIAAVERDVVAVIAGLRRVIRDAVSAEFVLAESIATIAGGRVPVIADFVAFDNVIAAELKLIGHVAGHILTGNDNHGLAGIAVHGPVCRDGCLIHCVRPRNEGKDLGTGTADRGDVECGESRTAESEGVIAIQGGLHDCEGSFIQTGSGTTVAIRRVVVITLLAGLDDTVAANFDIAGRIATVG
jgi:hypothetical protein